MKIIAMIINEMKLMLLPCAVSLPIIIISRFLTYKKTQNFNVRREVLMTLFWLYITAVLSVTLIPEFDINKGVNQFPLHLPDFSDNNTVIYRYSPLGWARWMITLGNYSELIRNIVGNIVVFIPYGVLVPILWKKVKQNTILFGFLLSLIIELCQLFLPRQTDLYDLILNTIGVAIGYVVYLIIKMYKRKSKVS